MTIDDFTLKTDRDANGSFETTEHIESFTLDSTGPPEAAPDNLLHDAAGNLKCDGPEKVLIPFSSLGTWYRL
jgi:hypothetical protein